jgi:hypothetical protein
MYDVDEVYSHIKGVLQCDDAVLMYFNARRRSTTLRCMVPWQRWPIDERCQVAAEESSSDKQATYGTTSSILRLDPSSTCLCTRESPLVSMLRGTERAVTGECFRQRIARGELS